MGGEISLVHQILLLQIYMIGAMGCLLVVAFGLAKWVKRMKAVEKKLDDLGQKLEDRTKKND